MSSEKIQQHIQNLIDPHSELALSASQADVAVSESDGEIRVAIKLGYPAAGGQALFAELVNNHLRDIAPGKNIVVTLSHDIKTHGVQNTLKPMKGIKNIIAVASGKGGVGKSTTAVNLALALRAEGASVGLLDADIYGPSQPRMLGITDKPESPDGKSVLPLENHGIKAMSIGFLIDEDSPMVWRGPMVTQALMQLLGDTVWGELDYLIIDLPPGTGDTQLTLSQKIPVAGAVIVTTPQDIALLDAKKGLKMFEKVNVPVLGIIENMSMHICSECGHAEPIFGEGGGNEMAETYHVPLLGQLPLDIKIREQVDNGMPSVAVDPDGKIASIYREIARKMTARLAAKSRDFSHKFPKIVVQNT